jgi:ligand-binding sensor protein
VQRHRGAGAAAGLRSEGGLVNERKGQRFIALCMLGMVLFNFPVLALFNVAGTVLGVPVLYAYIFAAWAAMIAVMALLAESTD